MATAAELPAWLARSLSEERERWPLWLPAAFGLGIHRCVGSNLARMEITVALEEWLKRIPRFNLTGEVAWSEGTVRGPRQLPLTFT